MKIEVGKFYRTRSGTKARIYATDGSFPFTVHGAVVSDKGDEWDPVAWDDEGHYMPESSNPYLLDLVSEWVEPARRQLAYITAWGGAIFSEVAIPNCTRAPWLDAPEGDSK